MIDNSSVKSNESALTGEPDDLVKSLVKDPFLLSSCIITDAVETRALVIAVGPSSQWGKIKESLVSEMEDTPLQEKLNIMTNQIGYCGMASALGTFAALIISIWARDGGRDVSRGVINAFILAVTIIVVAIPEGLPLSVVIALAYSSSKMYEDKNFVKVLAACETMGNATNICSDKTGTLTENMLTVVEGYFGSVVVNQEEFPRVKLNKTVETFVAENACLNRIAYLNFKDKEGKLYDKPMVIGNKTEGALLFMSRNWGYDEEQMKIQQFTSESKMFSFNSDKKRATVVLHRPDGSVTLYCKGASEWILKDCTSFLDRDGSVKEISRSKRDELDTAVTKMAERALRTLCLGTY